MTFPVAVLTASATVIFVAGHLVLFAAASFMLVLASCIYKCASLMKTDKTRTGYRHRVIEHGIH
jgi:hypothetical protein